MTVIAAKKGSSDQFLSKQKPVILTNCFRQLVSLLWSPYVIGRPLYFHPVSSSFFFLFSSPNLSGRRLDVYHTLAHGVALVRI